MDAPKPIYAAKPKNAREPAGEGCLLMFKGGPGGGNRASGPGYNAAEPKNRRAGAGQANVGLTIGYNS